MAGLDAFQIGSCVVYRSANLLRGRRGEATLPPRIMKVLLCLAEHAPETASRHALLARGWDAAGYVSDEALTRAVSDLRKALRGVGCAEEVVRTVPKRGYRLVVMPAPLPADREGFSAPAAARPPARPHTEVYPLKPGRRRATSALALAMGFVIMTGLGFLLGSQRAASPEPEVRVVRQAVPLDSLADGEALLRKGPIDTVFVGAGAREIIEALNAASSPDEGSRAYRVRTKVRVQRES